MKGYQHQYPQETWISPRIFCHGHLQFQGKDAPKPTPTHSAHLGLHDSEAPHRHFSAQARAKRRAALFLLRKNSIKLAELD